MPSHQISIRQSSIGDIDSMVKLRRIMFESMGFTDECLLDQADQAAREYFLSAIPSGQFVGWIAEKFKNPESSESSEKQTVGTGGLIIDTHTPGPNNLSGKIGYILNLVVIDKYRKQGIAKQIMEHILIWLKANNITMANLHYTEMGKSLYEKLGFKLGNEMKLTITKKF